MTWFTTSWNWSKRVFWNGVANFLMWLKDWGYLLLKILFGNPVAWLIYIALAIAHVAYLNCEYQIHDKFVEGKVYNYALTDNTSKFILIDTGGTNYMYSIENLYRRAFTQEYLSQMRLTVKIGKRFRIGYVEDGVKGPRYVTSVVPLEE